MSARKDWGPPRSAMQHIGYLQDGQNPAGLIVRLVTHLPIPTSAADQAEVKTKRIVGTILSFPKLGYVSAPYSKKAKTAKDQPGQPKKLLEIASTTQYGEVTAVRVFGFHKVNSNFDKGNRDEECVSTLVLGQTLTFYLNEFMFDTKEKAVFPEGVQGVIAPYTVIEVQLNPSHNQSKGYGLKVARITPQGPTLYSYLASQGFSALSRTSEEASLRAKSAAQDCLSIANQVEQSRYAFTATVDPSARVVDIREDLDFLRIECSEESGTTPVPGVYCLDVSFDDMQRFTNFPGDLMGARTLMDLAIAAGALRVLVTYDDYYNHKETALSQFRCVPLIDTEVFLKPVEAEQFETSRASLLFPAHWTVRHEPILQVVGYKVSTVPATQEEGQLCAYDQSRECLAPPCPDMVLCSPACAFQRGYRVLVGNPGSEEDESFYVLDCFFNAAPKATTGSAGSGGKPGRTTGYKRVLSDGDMEDE